MKDKVIGVIKRTWIYKLLKGSEAVVVLGGLALGIILGWFAKIPAVIIMAAYGVLNFRGLDDAPLYQVRDELKDKFDKRS